MNTVSFLAIKDRPISRARADEAAGISEETANFLTHALGFLLSLAGTAALLTIARAYADPWQFAGCVVYGVSLISLYAASTLSHAFERPRLRHFFRTLDQVCIFLLIAGTYTPILLAFFRDGYWWTVLAGVWVLATAGILFKVLITRLDNVAMIFYVLLGWLPSIALRPVAFRVPTMAIGWLLLGGVLYTIGTIFLARDEKVPYFHAIWHLFVIAGSACHYVAVLFFVVPWPNS